MAFPLQSILKRCIAALFSFRNLLWEYITTVLRHAETEITELDSTLILELDGTEAYNIGLDEASTFQSIESIHKYSYDHPRDLRKRNTFKYKDE